ncbi:hypothetical protein M0804_009785 [Polistes exclamans]|nr:hypothetical protein M0804_009785 [Polistes exclamans]
MDDTLFTTWDYELSWIASHRIIFNGYKNNKSVAEVEKELSKFYTFPAVRIALVEYWYLRLELDILGIEKEYSNYISGKRNLALLRFLLIKYPYWKIRYLMDVFKLSRKTIKKYIKKLGYAYNGLGWNKLVYKENVQE